MSVKSVLINSAKALGQGVGFAFLAYIAALVWTRLFEMYPGLNGWLLLIGALVLLAIGFGFLNILLMYALWFPVDRDWKSFLPQGLILGAIIFAIDILPLHFMIPALVNLGYVPYLAGFVVVNLFYSFADGWIAVKLGAHWKVRGLPTMAESYVAFTPEPEIVANNPKGVHCPRCGGVNLVVAPDHSAYCIDCGRGIRRELLGTAFG